MTPRRNTHQLVECEACHCEIRFEPGVAGAKPKYTAGWQARPGTGWTISAKACPNCIASDYRHARAKRVGDVHVLWDISNVTEPAGYTSARRGAKDTLEEEVEITVEVFNGIGEHLCRALLKVCGKEASRFTYDREELMVRVFAVQFRTAGSKFDVRQIDGLD